MLPENGNMHQHLQAPFAQAPYVHPLNKPRYQAQLLRALNFAKHTGQRLMWTLATDVPATGNDDAEAEGSNLEKQRQQWRLLPDSDTAGIPGLLPLVHEMPLRFTQTEDRKQGVFKNSRGTLVGVLHHERNAAAIAASTAPEIVLPFRPKALLIRVETATAAMPNLYGEKVYALVPKRRTWARDRAGNYKIRRSGFAVIPAFGGTAHAYCGDTLDAAVGDLLAWYRKPSRDDMLRGYIIESRPRSIDTLLVVQPYSPALFTQGDLPGPHILMSVLRGTRTLTEAKREWDKAEADKQSRKGEEWPQSMRLPCRVCTDKNNGEEVRRPLCAFDSDRKYTEMWKTIALGQDMTCYACKHRRLMDARKLNTVLCDGCERILPQGRFTSAEMEKIQLGVDEEVYCKSCQGLTGKRKAQDVQAIVCHGSCQKALPDTHFVPKLLDEWQTTEQQHNALCAKCWLESQSRLPEEPHKCGGCKQKKAANQYSGAFWVNYIVSRHDLPAEARCLECQYPACCECGNRPFLPPPQTNHAKADYMCEKCRFPPCAGCGRMPRPRWSKTTKTRCRDWYCLNCRVSERCYTRPRAGVVPTDSGDGNDSAGIAHPRAELDTPACGLELPGNERAKQ